MILGNFSGQFGITFGSFGHWDHWFFFGAFGTIFGSFLGLFCRHYGVVFWSCYGILGTFRRILGHFGIIFGVILGSFLGSFWDRFCNIYQSLSLSLSFNMCIDWHGGNQEGKKL